MKQKVFDVSKKVFILGKQYKEVLYSELYKTHAIKWGG